jgi:hypothetical protein
MTEIGLLPTPFKKIVILVLLSAIQVFAQNADSIYIAKSNLFSEKLFKAGLTEWYYYFRIPKNKLIDSNDIYKKVARQCHYVIKKMFNPDWAPDSAYIVKNIQLFAGKQNRGMDIAFVFFQTPNAFYSLAITAGDNCAIYIFNKANVFFGIRQDTLLTITTRLKSMLDTSLLPFWPEKYKVQIVDGVYFIKPVHIPSKYVNPCWCFFVGPNEMGFVFREFYPGKVSPCSPRSGNEWFDSWNRKSPKYQKTHYDSVYEKEWERRIATFMPERKK